MRTVLRKLFRQTACASVTWLLLAPPALHADPNPAAFYAEVPQPEVPIPANGVIPISSDVAEPPIVIVAASDDLVTPLPGTLTQPEGSELWAWKPDTPLEPGSYSVTTRARSITYVTEQTITIIAPFTFEAPSLIPIPELVAQLMVDMDGCCTSPTKERRPCFGEGEHRQPRIDFLFGSMSTPELMNQFALYVTDIDGLSEGPARRSFMLNALTVSFLPREVAEQYCFEVEAIDLVTGERHTFPELNPTCVPHGSFGEAGWVQQHTEDAHLLALDRCVLAPEALRDQWCEINAGACADMTADEAYENDCRFYDFSCNGGELPPIDNGGGEGGTMIAPPVAGGGDGGGTGGIGSPPLLGGTGGGSAGAAGMAGSGGGAGMTPAGSGGAQEPASATNARAAGCACSSAGSARRDPAPLVALALLALGVATARTRRRRHRLEHRIGRVLRSVRVALAHGVDRRDERPRLRDRGAR